MGMFGTIFGSTGDVEVVEEVIASRPVVVGPGIVGYGTGAISVAWQPHAAGDIGLLQVETDDADAVAAPSGWAEVPGSPVINASAGTRLTVFWRRAESDAEPNAAIADPGDHVTARLSVVRNVSADANPFDDSDSRALTSGASGTVTAPGGTTTVDGCLVCLIFASPTDQSADDVFVDPVNADLFELRFIESNGTTMGNGGGLGFMAGIKVEAGAFGDTSASHVDSSGGAVSILTTSLMLALKPGGVPGGPVDEVPPTITLISPEDGELGPDTPIVVDVEDETGISLAALLVRYPSGASEELYNGYVFGPHYRGGVNAVEVLDDGKRLRFTVLRLGGWRAAPRVEFVVRDGGNAAVIAP